MGVQEKAAVVAEMYGGDIKVPDDLTEADVEAAFRLASRGLSEKETAEWRKKLEEA